MTSDKWTSTLRNIINRHLSPHDFTRKNPIAKPEQSKQIVPPTHFMALDPGLKVKIVYWVTEWLLSECEAIKASLNLMRKRKGNRGELLPLGFEKRGAAIYHCGEYPRLYRSTAKAFTPVCSTMAELREYRNNLDMNHLNEARLKRKLGLSDGSGLVSELQDLHDIRCKRTRLSKNSTVVSKHFILPTTRRSSSSKSISYSEIDDEPTKHVGKLPVVTKLARNDRYNNRILLKRSSIDGGADGSTETVPETSAATQREGSPSMSPEPCEHDAIQVSDISDAETVATNSSSPSKATGKENHVVAKRVRSKTVVATKTSRSIFNTIN